MKKLLLVSTLIVFLVPALCMADVPTDQGNVNRCKRFAKKVTKVERKSDFNKQLDACLKAESAEAYLSSMTVEDQKISLITNGHDKEMKPQIKGYRTAGENTN